MADLPINTRMRVVEWATLVDEADAGEDKTEHVAYQFSKKTFKETDEQGVYAPEE